MEDLQYPDQDEIDDVLVHREMGQEITAFAETPEPSTNNIYRATPPLPRTEQHLFRFFIDGSSLRTYFLATGVEGTRTFPIELAQVGASVVLRWVDLSHGRADGPVVISNITEKAKNKVDNLQTAIETDLLYPLLRSGDVAKWQALPSAWIIVAQDLSDPKHGYPINQLQADFPKTYSYLHHFKSELSGRPSLYIADTRNV